MSINVPRLPLSTVVAMINEWGSVPREVSLRPWTGYPDTGSSVRVAFDLVWPDDLGLVSDEEIVAAADQIYQVFAADWPGATKCTLNNLISELALVPVVSAGPYRLELSWSTSTKSRLLPATLLASLLDHLAVSPSDRFDTCNSRDCADILVDLSPRHNKRFCSTRCQTRERVRIYRGREIG